MQVLCRNFKKFIYLFINLNIRELLFSDFQITDGRQSHRFLFFWIKKDIIHCLTESQMAEKV